MTVAAAAQDTAEGAVVTAAGGAADVLSEAAGTGRLLTGELRSGGSDDFQQIRFGAARGSGSSSTGHCGGSSGESCRWCSGWFLVELQVELEQQNFQWNCRWTAAAIRTIFSELKCAAAWW